MIKRLMWSVFATLAFAAPALAVQAPAGQTGFVPMNSLPPADQLPAAPLLIAAYAFVWLAVMVYVFSIWKRMNKVEDEMRALAQKLPRQ
jgi:CcmD family protein